jgi:hypothetical protein
MILADKLYFHKLKAGCMIQQFDIISHDMVQGKKNWKFTSQNLDLTDGER